mgnify:CR=1 FL=1
MLPPRQATRHPESVGTDRLCAAVAAYDRLGTACVVAIGRVGFGVMASGSARAQQTIERSTEMEAFLEEHEVRRAGAGGVLEGATEGVVRAIPAPAFEFFPEHATQRFPAQEDAVAEGHGGWCCEVAGELAGRHVDGVASAIDPLLQATEEEV